MAPRDRNQAASGPRPATAGERYLAGENVESRGNRRHAGRPPHRSPTPVLGSEAEDRLIVGLQPVREAIRVHGPNLYRVAIDARSLPRLDAVARFARDHGVQTIVRLPSTELDGLAAGTQHQGVLAWAPPLAFVDAFSLLGRPNLIALALDQIQDPQNFGATIRSAVAIARAPVVWPEHASAPLTAATFRASAGAVEHATLCRVTSLVGWLNAARDQGVDVLGLDAHAPVRLSDRDLRGPTILVVGSEHEGLRRSVRRACSQVVSIVGEGAIDSLNASVAAAVALYAVVESRARLVN
ncbi:MAG: RNA methyltransferase [Polyangiaceae bacterium]|nr:RNA methyltransferase [Polyangiaceae bacterium]